MKNEEIILEERIRLMKEGLIKGTGRKIINPLDKYEMIEEPEEINTKGAWAKRNLKIKEGEEPKTKIKIWKPYNKGNAKGVIKVEAEFYIKEQTEEIKNEHKGNINSTTN